MKVLLLYTTYEKQTFKIMQRIENQLAGKCDCDVIELLPTMNIDLTKYQAVLLGCSIRYGFYNKVMKKFIDDNYQQLNKIKSGFFGVNVVARKPHKNTPETNLYTRKFLAKIAWKPTIKAVFAGALYYPKYNWFDRNMIRFIMWLGKGDTDVTKPIIEYTDWAKVDQFATQFYTQTYR
ncbi:menaquinone-dependent protoporphyrinogen IX dehydrogenase [Gilliamella sp. B2776]|uniref:menaquinone-dependent protoporphyrinogen IX dehydrogenase n=1 Tax=unclassified Gilliamella TaxID=2685620 RepID=UPI002269C18D|nr:MULTISPECIES: menaquinone-dependent protoporphyrinogen IX dehydrogenase [unclassified Gilliamella]MCX8648979.1 menaquinone-dependent protoporphyrinogen IX dehydrogenase [Gilliamella sp. B2779]MCX8653145.1 menaquinone-dependent protoporphyrinogen IX dehydrogenase [Gilliamella sp. B2737]MCX8655405.1 menaquinone-dependent protoporphyrinogen IX dehydrogenase [Gilliamella sp. B2894]MCX8664170.1 menaquinone-dependent protoporphyrinogen IX dehydrogenase [Gilliamella sp. B2887]MCX8690791.1 menaquin